MTRVSYDFFPTLEDTISSRLAQHYPADGNGCGAKVLPFVTMRL